MHFSEKLCRRAGFARQRTRTRRQKLCLGLTACLAITALAEELPSAALLDAAEQAEREGHLIYPAQGSAMSLYHEMLFDDPDNEFAREGLTRIAEHYLEQAQSALEAGNLLKADTLVSQARMVYPDYPAVSALSRQIELVETAERHRQVLDWRQVAERSAALTPTLVRLGDLAKAKDCRVTINVSNDAEGRWVYQQMNRSAVDGRLRAEVKIASPAAVDVLCFADDGSTDDAS